MNLRLQTKNRVFIVVILIITLIILLIFNRIITKKNAPNQDCNCDIINTKDHIEKNPIDIADTNQKTNNTGQTSQQNENEDSPKYHLCLYYADWCGHSRIFLPEWRKIKIRILESGLNNSVECHDFNCENENDKKSCTKYSIKGYPTIYLHKPNGKIIPYESSRDTESINKFIKKEIK